MSDEGSQYIGYLSHPSLGEEPVRGRIRFIQWRFRFESEAMTREIPLPRMQIEVESEEEERICFFDVMEPDWRIRTVGGEILGERALMQQAHTRNQLQQFHSAPDFRRRIKLIGVFIASFAVICLLCSMALSVMVRTLVRRVPPSWEQKLGDDTMKEVKKHAPLLDDTNLQARLERSVAPLLTVLPKDMPPCKFYIWDEPLPNAFALPGGYVIVTKGLMNLADKPEDLAGVVAHELAHVTQKHHVRILISSAGPFFVVKTFFGGGEGMLGALGEGSQLLVRQSFSQDFEQEADDTGWKFLLEANIDPRGLAGMLRKLEDTYGNMNVIRPDLGPFSSHPVTEKRIERLNERWNKLPIKTGFLEYDEEDRHH